MAARAIRLGVAGLGRAFTLMLPTFARHPGVRLVAGADPRAEARQRFAADFGARTYESVAALCGDADVEAIYVATPHGLHGEHIRMAAAAGRHVLVEKPLAVAMDDARAAVEAMERAGRALVVGPSHSFDAPIGRTREMVESGDWGAVRMITGLNFTDFLYRPRRPEELDSAQGGGVVYSQGAHHLDIARLLGGGLATHVRALAGRWDAARPTEGAYAALVGFQDGAFASLTYNGYGGYDSDALLEWVGELGRVREPGGEGAMRRARATDADAATEAAAKNARNYGGRDWRAADAPPWHEHFGFLVVSCERGDLRPTPKGIATYGAQGSGFIALEPPGIPRREPIDELVAAVRGERAPRHDGRWGLATLEAVVALLRSAREGRDVVLTEQVAWGRA